ncbi:MAG: threonine synthase [Candidatus Ranarchaeia archaeon]|jgi:threonine synthase
MGNPRILKMVCSWCGKEYDPQSNPYRCKTPNCKGRLDIIYDYELIKSLIDKTQLAQRTPGVWKYFEFLPLNYEKNIVTLGEGGTPLLTSKRLAEKLNMKHLFIKDETRSPTGSFKDRPMTVGVSKAVEDGAKVLATASSGNAAAGMAAYAAKAGLESYTFVPDFAPLGKIAQLQLYGAKVVRLSGFEGEDPTAKLLQLVIDKYGWTPVPSFGHFNPYQTEGPKSIGFELSEEFQYDPPEWVIVQVGGAGLLTGIYRGFKEFKQMGWVDKIPHIVVAQSTGCAPVVRAWNQKKSIKELIPWEKVDTVAEGLEDPFPWDADVAFEAMRETKGFAVACTNEEILDAQRLLARYEGLFGEPSGTTGLSALIKLLDNGTIDRKDRVVILNTGMGLKDPDVVIEQFETPPIIKPTLEEFQKIFM